MRHRFNLTAVPSAWHFHRLNLSLFSIVRWVYVPTDFDTKEKALSGAKAAEKGLK